MSDVPDGTVQEVLDWVGDDPGRAPRRAARRGDRRRAHDAAEQAGGDRLRATRGGRPDDRPKTRTLSMRRPASRSPPVPDMSSTRPPSTRTSASCTSRTPTSRSPTTTTSARRSRRSSPIRSSTSRSPAARTGRRDLLQRRRPTRSARRGRVVQGGAGHGRLGADALMPTVTETLVDAWASCHDGRCPGYKQQAVKAILTLTEWSVLRPRRRHPRHRALLDADPLQRHRDAQCEFCGEPRQVADQVRPIYPNVSGVPQDKLLTVGRTPSACVTCSSPTPSARPRWRRCGC
jgi:hypothetical protein